jgi:uncharacterized membrane protein
MPAVLIRLLDAITAVTGATVEPQQRQVLARQGEMILAVAEASVREPRDLADVRGRHERLAVAIEAMDEGSSTASP